MIELANALWGVYRIIGKLEPRAYVVLSAALSMSLRITREVGRS